MSDEPHQFLTSGELDVNDLFSTKLQEGACTAHLRGVFTNTGEVEITLLKKNEELASPAFQAELNTLLGALRGDSGPLRDLPSMRAYCEARPQALMRGRQAFYAFRIELPKIISPILSPPSSVILCHWKQRQSLSEKFPKKIIITVESFLRNIFALWIQQILFVFFRFTYWFT